MKDYKEDPLNFVGKVRARTGNELLKVTSVKCCAEHPLACVHLAWLKQGNPSRGPPTIMNCGDAQAMRDMDRRKAEIAVPVVAIHGTADHTTSLVAVKTLLKECVSPDATLKEYSGALDNWHCPTCKGSLSTTSDCHLIDAAASIIEGLPACMGISGSHWVHGSC